MTTNPAWTVSPTVLVQLADPALRAVLLASTAGVLMAAFKVRSTSMRLAAWTAVLYAALGMPLLSWMLPSLNVPAPGFLHHAAVPPNTIGVKAPRAHPSLQNDSGTDLKMQFDRSTMSIDIHPRPAGSSAMTSYALRGTSPRPSIPSSGLAMALYVAVALVLFTRFIVGIILSRKLIRDSHTIHDRALVQSLIARARTCAIRSVPHIAESEVISVPVTMGILRAIILLPVSWREWDDAKLNAVLAHELSHVARRDALTQRLSLLHRAIFWFSPLAWWLHRHLAQLAEQASDEAALSCGADRTDYARTLLGFFETLHATPGRVWWQGVSMASTGQAEQRLERILAWKGAVTMGLRKSVLVAIIALALPVVYLAASVRPASASPQDSETQIPSPPAPRAAIAPAAPPATSGLPQPALAPIAPRSATPPAPSVINGIVSSGGRLWVAPAAPAAPVAVAPIAPLAPWPYQSEGRGHSYSYNYDDEQRFVIVSGQSDSVTMSGSSEDVRHAQKLKKQISGDFIWFEQDEKSYIIRDQATIDRARKLWAPQEELGKKQEELGKQQEALGKQQEELGKKMEQVQVKVPDMTAELDRLKAKLQKLGPNATMEQLGDLQSEIGDLQSKIGDIQSQAGEQQSKLGEQMGALGEKQGKLGEEQGKLGEQQGQLAEQASRQMKGLLDEAIKNGKAQPEPQTGGAGTL